MYTTGVPILSERIYRFIGKLVSIIGAILILFPVVFILHWFADANDPFNPPSIYVTPEGFLVMIGFISLGIIVTYSGLFILKRNEITKLYFIKDGGPIHSGTRWTKGSESGLYLTSCRLVVSINQESRATAHVGYKIVTAERATHRECIQKEGETLLDKYAHRRTSY